MTLAGRIALAWAAVMTWSRTIVPITTAARSRARRRWLVGASRVGAFTIPASIAACATDSFSGGTEK